jgi:acyl carrier protein
VSNKIEKNVIAHIAEYIGADPDKVTPGMDLFRDLGIDGDDAIDLITSFSKEFQVDVSNFDFGKHFGPEWPPSLLATLFRRIYSKANNITPLTIKDLIKAAEDRTLP